MAQPPNGETVDIFRDLDVGLSEMFHAHQTAHLFADIPADQPMRRLDRLNEFIQERLHARRQGFWRRYWGAVWVLRWLPLPTFRYRRFWREYLPRMRQVLLRIVLQQAVLFVRMLRITMFFIVASSYIHHALKRIFLFGNMLTFGESFLRDTVTYMFHDNGALLERHQRVQAHFNDVFWVIDSPEYDEYSSWRLMIEVAYNWVARLLMTECVFEKATQGSSRVAKCSLVDSSLIFKFSRILGSFFPQLGLESRKWLLKEVTVVVYNTYAIVGIIVCVNVFIFFSLNIGKRLLQYGDVLNRLATVVIGTVTNIM